VFESAAIVPANRRFAGRSILRRSIGLPLTIGIVLVLLALALAVGWNVLVVRGVGDVRQVAARLSGTHWVLLSLGTLFYALLIAGLTLLCAWLVREMLHSQRQQAFLDTVTHEMKTPLASLRLEIDGDPFALGEEQELALVFRNLLDNAVKYSGATVDVRVRAAQEPDGGVRVAIEDRGAGIPRDELRRIFQPFYRAGAEAQRRVKGLGLGLFIVRFLVRRQGGSVEAQSDGPGLGSRFIVRLRATSAALPPAHAAPLAAP